MDNDDFDWITEPLEQWLVQELQKDTKVPLNAYEILCEKCDRHLLVWNFNALAASPLISPDPLPQKFEEVGETAKRNIQVRPLDSWDTATLGRNLDDLRGIAKKAQGLVKDIKTLRKTTLVHILAVDDKIKTDDLLHPTCDYLGCFEGILGLPGFAEGMGPGKKPDYNALLTEIVQHVYERTGQWHDELVGQLNAALDLPHGTADAMKQWRTSRNLVSKTK